MFKILSGAILTLLVVSLSYLMFGKLGIPDGVTAVTPFDLKRIQGDWYEIARLDHGFEKGLSHVRNHYEIGTDGEFKLENQAFDLRHGTWQNTTGKGALIGDPAVGRLKISYFGPFYGSFNIIALDEKDYKWMMATGPSTHYLWILARDKALDDAVMQNLIRKAVGLGFKLEKLIYVDQKPESLPTSDASSKPLDQH